MCVWVEVVPCFLSLSGGINILPMALLKKVTLAFSIQYKFVVYKCTFKGEENTKRICAKITTTQVCYFSL